MERVGEIGEAAGVYAETKIEELTERKLRFDHPEQMTRMKTIALIRVLTTSSRKPPLRRFDNSVPRHVVWTILLPRSRVTLWIRMLLAARGGRHQPLA